jgi:hypothetical protein
MTHEPIEDPVFGTLSWDDSLNWWYAEVDLTPKHTAEVFIDWDEDESLEVVLARCRAVFERVRKNEFRYRLDTAAALLELDNETWRQDEDEVQTRDSFARKLSLASLYLRQDGSVELWV